MGNAMRSMGNNWRQSGGIDGLMADPWMNIGLGIMNANGQSSSPIATGALQGYQNSVQQRAYNEDRKTYTEEVERRKKAMEKLQAAMAKVEPQQTMLPDGTQINMQDGLMPAGNMAGRTGRAPGRYDGIIQALIGSGDPQMVTQGIALSGQMGGDTPAMKNADAYANMDPKMRRMFDMANGNTPGASREFDDLSQMSPPEQDLWFRNKRATQFENAGGVPYQYNPVTGGMSQAVPLGTVADNKSVIAGSVAAATADAGYDQEQRAQADKLVVAYDDAITHLDKIINDPNLPAVTGESGPWNTFKGYIPFTGNVDSKARIVDFGNKIMPIAYENAKGAGPLAVQETEWLAKGLANIDQPRSEEESLLYYKNLRDNFAKARERMNEHVSDRFKKSDEDGKVVTSSGATITFE